MSKKLQKFNHYPEFETNERINQVINYKQTGMLPPSLSKFQSTNFIKKFGPHSGFRTAGNTLIYSPTPIINIKVARPNQRDSIISKIYHNPKEGLGNGLASFYHKVASQYLNITKRKTDEFLRNQANYQLAKTPRVTMHKPVSTQAPNQRWQIDLIDMTFYPAPIQNAGRKYILTLVDTFSSKVFLRGLKNREAETIVSNLADVCNEAGTTPHILQGDNEFTSGLFKDWCNNQIPKVKLINGNPFSSQSTGKVERTNQEVRRRTRAGFIAHNDFVWFEHLQDYAENINNTQSARYGRTPNELWNNNPYVKPPATIPEPIKPTDKMTASQLRDQQRALLNERNNQLLTGDRQEHKFKKGDKVRLNLASGIYNNKMKKAKKEDIGWNKVSIHWTPEIYTVIHAVPTSQKEKAHYTVATADGEYFINKKFYGNDLQIIRDEPATVQTNVSPKTIERALELNRMTR